MIKPVYFGKEDEILLNYVNELADFNFSDWVKKNIREKMGINNTVKADNNQMQISNKEDIKDIEMLIRRIIKEENMKITGEDKVHIDLGEKELNMEESDLEKIEICGWTL